MAPDEASWATFMGQVEHGLRLALAQAAPKFKMAAIFVKPAKRNKTPIISQSSS